MASAADPGVLTVSAQAAADGVTTYAVSIETLLVFAALSFIPALILMMTSFTRIVIVLSLMRQALGLQTTPPNQVIIGMSLFLTFFVMSPTLEKVYTNAYEPYSNAQISLQEATARASDALRSFMLAQTREADIELFRTIAGEADRADATDATESADPAGTPGEADAAEPLPMRIMIPAFVISELKTAFQIGFLIFIPFLVIDLVVASVLMSMGMMMLSPVLVSLPFKLMLFVLADGWRLLIGSMVSSFGPGG